MTCLRTTIAAICATVGIGICSLPVNSQTLTPTIRGDIDDSGIGSPPAPDNNYFVGSSGQDPIRSYFDFNIPTISGNLIAATLELDQPGGANPGHSGPADTVSVYSLAASGMPTFADLSSGTLYGTSALLDDSSDGTTVDISLNSTALSAILAAQGGGFNLAGASSSELSTPTVAGDFGFTYPGGPVPFHSVLVLTTGREQPSTPEPGVLALACGISAFGIAGILRRRRKCT